MEVRAGRLMIVTSSFFPVGVSRPETAGAQAIKAHVKEGTIVIDPSSGQVNFVFGTSMASL